MQIGAFAKACNTEISILRHYDKVGLLKPDFIDKFTGYRYYSAEQIKIFEKISVLKKGAFSLKEIQSILEKSEDNALVLDFIENKRKKFKDIISNLDHVKKILIGDVVMEKMNAAEALNENIDVPFENDEEVIGKWLIIGEYDTKQEFFDTKSNNKKCYYGDKKNEIYFLPNGERYWVFGWTKGFIISDDGVYTALNPYNIEIVDDTKHVFVKWKSYEYFKGGKETILVLKQLDAKAYTKDEITRKDNIDMPFIEDTTIIGKWKSISWCRRIEEFSPENINSADYFKEIEFFEGGRCVSVYKDGIITSPDMQTWTKGFVLRKYNSNACAYVIKTKGNKEYLFMEWKSGDYRWGGYDTNYYVFERE